MKLRAVLGEAICCYHVRTAEDPKLQASIIQCIVDVHAIFKRIKNKSHKK